MGRKRETGSCFEANLIYLLFCVITMLDSVVNCQLIKEINRDYHGDIFILSSDFVSCDPSLCTEDQRFAAPVSGHPCKCQCDPSKQVFREDIQQCVRDLDDCPLVTFTRTYISETIPVVSLPTAGQLVHPGAHLNLENRNHIVNQTCRVESDMVMTSDGWIPIDNRPVFALIIEGSRSFLQWIGNDHNRRQLEQKLVLIRFNCQLKPRHGSIEIAPYRPCAAVRIGWVPGSSLSLLNNQIGGYDGSTGSGNQNKGTSGYLIIGLSIGILGLTYVLSLMIYLRSKRVDRVKHHHNHQIQHNPYNAPQAKQSLNRHGSSYYGDSSSNQTGSSSLDRGKNHKSEIISSGGTVDKKDSFTLSMGESCDENDEFNPSIISVKSNKSENILINNSCSKQDVASFNPFNQHRLPMSSLTPMSTCFPSSVPVSHSVSSTTSTTITTSTSAALLPNSPSVSSTSSLHTSSPSPPSPSSSLLLSQSLSSSPNQHTQSSLTSLQTRVNEKSSQFNVQTTSQPGLACRKPARLSKRDLAIAPKLLDPEALSSPSPTAIEFLSRLREVITSARGRMRAFRFKPTLLVIPEDDYFIEEPESRYKSISSSIDSMNTSSLESYGEISRTDFQKYLIVGETLSLYPYGHENFHSYSRSQHLQPLSLPAELSRHLTDKLKPWKLSGNQSSLSPDLSLISDGNPGSSSSSSNDISDPEVPQSPHRSQYHEKLQSSSSLSPTYRSCEDSASVAWNNDNSSRVSRREIVDRLAEEIATNDSCEANNNAENDDNHDNNEADSLNDLSDINENLFETSRSLGNMYDNITSENLVNLSNEVEKKLAQRSIVPLPEVVANVNEGNKMKIADGIKSSSQHHSREDSKLSQLVADLKHFTRKRKQIKTSKSLPVVSDNNWMLQPVASMSLRLSSSRSSRPSISSGQPGNRSMRNNSSFTSNGISRLNKNQAKFTANNKSEEMSQVTIQEGRYLNLNNHSPVSDDDRSIGNEITSSRCGLETWSLSSELSTGSSSPIYGKNIDNDSFGNQYILDTMAHHDEDEMFISFTGNQFESTLDDNEIGYISRFNLIKKYIDNPDNFDVKDAKKSDGRVTQLEGRNQSTERQKIGKDNIATYQIDSTNHLNHAINSQSTNQRRSIDYKHYQPSAQSLSSLTSTLPTSYSEMCSSDDGMSSASVSSIMFIESPNQGRRKSVDRRLTKGITERGDQSHYGNNVANNNNFMMMKGSIRGSCNNINKMIQPSNGIRLTRQNPVQKRYFPNGLMTIA